MEMPESLRRKRDELADERVDSTSSAHIGFRLGFNAAWEELVPVVEALRFYAGEHLENSDVARQALEKLK